MPFLFGNINAEITSYIHNTAAGKTHQMVMRGRIEIKAAFPRINGQVGNAPLFLQNG